MNTEYSVPTYLLGNDQMTQHTSQKSVGLSKSSRQGQHIPDASRKAEFEQDRDRKYEKCQVIPAVRPDFPILAPRAGFYWRQGYQPRVAKDCQVAKLCD